MHYDRAIRKWPKCIFSAPMPSLRKVGKQSPLLPLPLRLMFSPQKGAILIEAGFSLTKRMASPRKGTISVGWQDEKGRWIPCGKRKAR